METKIGKLWMIMVNLMSYARDEDEELDVAHLGQRGQIIYCVYSVHQAFHEALLDLSFLNIKASFMNQAYAFIHCDELLIWCRVKFEQFLNHGLIASKDLIHLQIEHVHLSKTVAVHAPIVR